MSKSVRRVESTARDLGLDIAVLRMPESTRTAADAARACGCNIGQIVKSLVFEGTETGALKLLLVSGANTVDTTAIAANLGEALKRTNATRVRAETGFAIGGVAPIGHLSPIATFIDEALFDWPVVWAAAGAPDTVFEIAPKALAHATRATPITL